MSALASSSGSGQTLMSTELFDVIEKGNTIVIKTKTYDEGLVSIIKSLYGTKKWDPFEKVWIFPKEAKDAILRGLSRLNLRPIGKTMIGGVEVDLFETDAETVFAVPRMLSLPVFKREIEKTNARALSVGDKLYVYVPKGYEKLFYEAFEKTIGRAHDKPTIVVTYSRGSPEIGGKQIIEYYRDSHSFAKHPSYEPLISIRMFSRGSRRYPAYFGVVAISTRLPHLISNYEHRVDLLDTPEARKKLFDLIDKFFGEVGIKETNYVDINDKKIVEGFFEELKKLSGELAIRNEVEDEIARLEKEIEELEKMLQEKRRRLEELRMKREAARLI